MKCAWRTAHLRQFLLLYYIVANLSFIMANIVDVLNYTIFLCKKKGKWRSD